MSLTLDPRVTALVLVDVQNGVLGMPLSPHGADTLLANALALGHRFRERGALIALVNVAFAPDGADRLKQPVDAASPVVTLPAGYSDFRPRLPRWAPRSW